MMDPDKELALLEQEFPKSRRAWIRDTPIALDDRILSLAVRHAPYLEARYELKQEMAKLDPNSEPGGQYTPDLLPFRGSRPGARSRPASPVHESFSDDMFSSTSMSASSNREPPLPPGAEKLLMTLAGATPQEWLNRISRVVLLGDIDLAIYLLKEYRDRFPD